MVSVEKSLVIDRKPAYLLLQDGTLFKGYSFGADVDCDGEIGTLIT